MDFELFDEAIARYQQVLAKQPDRAEVHHKLAEVYYAQGKWSEAIAACHQALLYQPTFAEFYKTLGNILQSENKIDAAIRAYSKAIEINPNFGEALANLGSMFYKQGRLDAAVITYQKALEIDPNLAAVYWNLGKVLQEQGKLEESLKCQQKALEIQPNLLGIQSYLLRGNALIKAGKIDEAIDNYRQATQLNSNDASAYFYLAGALFDKKLFAEAIATYQRAIELKPDFAEAYCNQAIAFVQEGKAQDELNSEQLDRAINNFLKAIELKPDFSEAHQGCFELLAGFWTGNLTIFQEALDRYAKLSGKTSKILATTASISSHLQAGSTQIAKNQFLALENLLYQDSSELSPTEIEALYSHLLFNAPHLRDDLLANSNLFRFIAKQLNKHYKNATSEKVRSHPSVSERFFITQTPLRIGFLSQHFCRHSVGWCSYDVIHELSQITPHLHFYVTGQIQIDDLTHKFKQLGENFYISQNYRKGFANPQEIIERIIEDRLDVLVDLDSLTVPIHAEILYHQPAPLCISWLGFEAPFISSQNYFLGNQWTHPKGSEDYYLEKLIRLPNSWIAVSGFQTQPADAINLRKARRISLDQVVYLCVAPGRKLNSEMVRAQVKILKEVPNSVLIYKGLGDMQVIYSLYQQELAEQGVGLHRIKFINRTKTEEQHRSLYLLADVILDSYPYNGGTHTLEALWFNVPLVTRVGQQYLSRMGYSLLKSLGIDAGVAENWEEYTQWGIRLGQDVALRNTIREQLVKSKKPDSLAPLWNPKKLAQELYAVFAKLLQPETALSNLKVSDLLI